MNSPRARIAIGPRATLLAALWLALGCSSGGGAPGSGGSNGSGGSASGGSGSGGKGSGGSASGGSNATGGSASGGSSGSGGSATGGSATGGSATGGSATGGSASGGSASGGSASGGSASGGSASGGSASGGSATGGNSGGAGGRSGSGGSAGMPGSLSGGSSARANCQAGATYPASPLTGMGTISMIKPDNATTPNYFAFVEGPVWIASLGTLFFSDNVSPERVWKLMPGGTPQVLLNMSNSNGLAVDNDDKIIATDQEMKRLVRIDPAKPSPVSVVVPAGNFKPNDVIVRSDGNIYFSDPDSGFYWYSSKGTLTGPMKQVNRPNGILLSIDENTLIVGDVGNQQIHTFALAADGTVMTATDKLFVTAKNTTVDGMCMDCAGNLYAATSAGVEVYSPTAMYIGTVMTGDTSNCTFGGADRKTLYTTSRSAIGAVTLGIPGLPD
jgi:gluconolactonase